VSYGAQTRTLIGNVEKLLNEKENTERMCGPTYENGYWKKKIKKIIKNMNPRTL
jgi:hypothetical protein